MDCEAKDTLFDSKKARKKMKIEDDATMIEDPRKSVVLNDVKISCEKRRKIYRRSTCTVDKLIITTHNKRFKENSFKIYDSFERK
jgi:hypothetical protein